MSLEVQSRSFILILEDSEEIGCLLEKMLEEDGYDVNFARDEEDAVLRARYRPPDLILMSVNLDLENLVASAQRIRHQANLAPEVAVVIFCVATIPESAEWEIRDNIYATRPDNFDQLTYLLHRLLRERSPRR